MGGCWGCRRGFCWDISSRVDEGSAVGFGFDDGSVMGGFNGLARHAAVL
jgi:hypothetical protein